MGSYQTVVPGGFSGVPAFATSPQPLSYAPAPLSYAPPPAPPPPSELADLTAGMPDPSTVAKQKEGYLKLIAEQEQQGQQALDQQRKHQMELIRSEGEQQKKQYNMQVDQQRKYQMELIRSEGEQQ